MQNKHSGRRNLRRPMLYLCTREKINKNDTDYSFLHFYYTHYRTPTGPCMAENKGWILYIEITNIGCRGTH